MNEEELKKKINELKESFLEWQYTTDLLPSDRLLTAIEELIKE